MLSYIIRRIIYMIVVLLVLSVVSFFIIQLPPGDFLTAFIENMRAQGTVVGEEQILLLKTYYGLDQPMYLQYLRWLGNLLQGDLGQSFQWNQPVTELIKERLALTVTISLISLVLTYLIAIPIGIYSATHQYSLGDYAFTVFGFMGLATPNFLLALVLMFLLYKYAGWSVGGLFSPEYVVAPWSLGKVVDLLKHLPIPLVVISTAGTAWTIRVMRGCLLDELKKQYVITARSKGLTERSLLMKYPIRIAINPVISTIGGLLPTIISGATLTSIVISLPTIGPLLLRALRAQDMFLAGSMLMLLSALGIIGNLISDMLLVAIDPRIRFENQAQVRS
ncbi:MAG: ABC transporter permease [Spirochaetaceae bacterium]|nr:ABC transporter permease [Spirochaetaceae bacterium]